ncbi:MAG TPA: ATP-binding protein [Symbiobacteriaceae bacterium]|nr:ATP-binding protein [Symbiobacteriaceae bacterium]
MAWYWRLSFVAKTMLLVLFAVGVVGIYWHATYSVVEEVSHLTAQGAKTQQIRWLVAELEESALATQNALRGYALSGQERFKTQYEQAAARYGGRSNELAELLTDDRAALTTLLEAEAHWQNWLQFFAAPSIEEIDAAKPLGIGRIDRSTDLIDQVYERLNLLESTAEHAIEETDPKPLMRQYYRNVVLLNVLAIGLVAIFFYSFAARLAREVRTLILGAEAVSNGQVGFQVPPVATPELSRLVTHFNAMSRSLQGQAEELRAQHEELSAQNEMLVQGQGELTNIKAEVERERDNLASLNRLVTRSQGSRSLGDLCDQILDWLLERAQAEVGAIMIREGGGQGYIVAQVGLTDEAAQTAKVEGLMAEAIQKGRVIAASYPEGGLGRPVFNTIVPVAHEAYFPIIYAGMPLAVAVVGTTHASGFPSYSGSMLRMTTDTIGAVMTNRLSYDQLAEAYEQLRVRKQEISRLSESMARQRDEAAQKRDLLHAVLNSTGEGIFVGLAAVDRVFFNEHFFRMLALPTPEESISLAKLEALLAPTLARLHVAETIMHLKANPQEVYSARLHGVGEERRSFLWTSAPVLDCGGGLLGRVFVLRDITPEVEAERVKEEFISTVSHELRTPLTSIRGYLELLLDGDLGAIEPEQRDVLEVMNQNATQLLSLINDLLEIEKLAQGRLTLTFVPVNVAEVLQRVVRMGEQAARTKGLQLETAIEEALPKIQADEGRLVQIFTNLLSNAIKYTKQGRVTIRAQQEAGWIRVAVQDTGIGIAPEHQRKLFERFFRVDNAYTRSVGGIGLGLPITKELVERHGGRLEVASVLGQGSTFTVLLPLEAPKGGARDGEDRVGGG